MAKMKKTIILMLITLSSIIIKADQNYPASDYEYSIRREELKNAELAFQGTTSHLNQDEQLVDHYLQHLKWTEFLRTKDRFLPSLSLNETIMEEIMQTELYKALYKLPKGGSMHSHENHELGKRKLLEIVWGSNDFDYLWMTDPIGTTPYYSYRLQFGINAPTNLENITAKWIKVKDSNYSIDDILKYQTLFGILSDYARAFPTNTARRWSEMNPLWGRASDLIDNFDIKREYLKAMYKKNLDEGVQYIETRKVVGGRRFMYKVDANATDSNGIVYLDTAENAGQAEINMTLDVLEQFMKENPSFIGHKRITYSTRNIDVKDMQENMDKAVQLHNMYPNHLLGFDMVGEEDAGRSHIFFLNNFMNAYDPKTKTSKVPFFQHTGETNWPGDLITSKSDDDPMATIQNTYDAVLLGSRRVGHGLGYIKHPFLLKTLKDKDVAVEICPISNQVLGYIVDLRNHPAINYFRSGVPVVLGTDDPGTFGYDHFTIDWYAVYLAWGLDLADMKHLSQNAINYSGMNVSEKKSAMDKLNDLWAEYINHTKIVACAKDYNTSSYVGKIIPNQGLKSGGTKVHIFGRRFDKAIKTLCGGGKPKCKFGEKETDAMYITNNHLVCEAPTQDTYEIAPGMGGDQSYKVYISLDGSTWEDTGEVFKYNQDPLPTRKPKSPITTPSSSTSVRGWADLVWLISLVILTQIW